MSTRYVFLCSHASDSSFPVPPGDLVRIVQGTFRESHSRRNIKDGDVMMYTSVLGSELSFTKVARNANPTFIPTTLLPHLLRLLYIPSSSSCTILFRNSHTFGSTTPPQRWTTVSSPPLSPQPPTNPRRQLSKPPPRQRRPSIPRDPPRYPLPTPLAHSHDRLHLRRILVRDKNEIHRSPPDKAYSDRDRKGE